LFHAILLLAFLFLDVVPGFSPAFAVRQHQLPLF
jgi:hypothetical protein